MSEYIKNKDFYELLVEYNAEQDSARKNKLRDKIANNIFLIAKKLATKYNFNGYSFVEDMVGEGTVVGLKGIDKFNPEKSNNPFAFFTQIIYNAFIGVIMDERKKHNVPEEFGEFLTVEPSFETVSDHFGDIIRESKEKPQAETLF